MVARCRICGEPAVRSNDGWLVCELCDARLAEAERRWAEYEDGRITWNTSQHDPFWRGWLLSRELFETIHGTAPRVGQKLRSALGGDLFEYGRDSSCWVQVWVAPSEVVAAYPSVDERFGRLDTEGGPFEFEGWIGHLRYSAPLELGHGRGRCSYGATLPTASPSPVVKWAQAGDWAALARSWFIGEGQVLAPWP